MTEQEYFDQCEQLKEELEELFEGKPLAVIFGTLVGLLPRLSSELELTKTEMMRSIDMVLTHILEMPMEQPLQ